MWFLHQYAPQSGLYCVPAALELKGTPNGAWLQDAFRAVIRRHAVLRTTFAMENGELLQRVPLDSDFQLQELLLDQTSEEPREAALARCLDEAISRPFDLSVGLPIRGMLIRLKPDRSVLLVTLHHICTDGWSMGVFWRDLELAYSAYAQGQPPGWAELPIQYADYAAWQRDRLKNQELDEQLNYWKRTLADLPKLELPTDRPRPAVSTNHGAHFVFDLSEPLTRGVKELGRREGTTLFMTLLAAFHVLLHRYTHQQDIAVGTPIAGRGRQNLESLIGFYVNTLVLRCQLLGKPTFRELLTRIKDCALDAYAHQDIPFEKLVEELAPARVASGNPLFQVMFVLESTVNVPASFAGQQAEPIPLHAPGSKFDLTLSGTDTGRVLRVTWDYSTDLFDATTIVRMAGHFQTLLEGIVVNADQPVDKIGLLSPAERHQLLFEWNNTATDYPRAQQVHELFEKQVAQTAEGDALRFEGRRLSYRRLNHQSNQLARYLREQGVGRATLVGICVERSPEMIISVLAILKAGGAYVPIDPDYPQARLEFVVEDTQLSVLLTQVKWKDKLAPLRTRLICLETEAEGINKQSEADLEANGSPEDPAYVNYTSGSTGRPKGVLVPHRAVVRLVKQTNYVGLSAESTLLHAAPLSFDASTFELWGALLNGGCVVILPPGPASLSEIGDAIRSHAIDTLWLTAGLFHLMAEQRLEDLRPLRQLLAGGDVLSPEVVLKTYRALPECRLINGYGPTENTTFTCCHTITSEQDIAHHVPIGRPIANTQVYILDDNREPVPVGVEGELYAGGDGVAIGYLNRPDLNAERFIADRFRLVPGARLYRTGDRARWRPDGTIEFRGRQDHQVKIRGFRVELGEIETVLSGCPGLSSCAVISQPEATGGQSLAAFVTASETGISEASVRLWLEQRLPDYMVPARITLRPTLPLTPNGKVDRNALAAHTTDAPSLSPHQPPTDPLERHLIELWRNVLHRDQLGVTDNFFELGGHSMLALRLFSELERALSIKLPLATLFQAPTVEKLARVLRDKGWKPPWQSLVIIQKGDGREPLFLIHGIGGNVLGFRDLAVELGENQPVFGVQSPGLDGKSPLLDRVEEMAKIYLEEILALQPKGPYHLCGLSFGGVVAFELAQQLSRGGHAVGLLALLDTHPPGHTELLPLRQRVLERMQSWKNRVQGHLRELSKRNDWKQYLQKKAKTLRRRLRSRIWQWKYKSHNSRDSHLPKELRSVKEANTLAASRYTTQHYAGKVTLLLAAEHQASTKDALRRIWSNIALGGLEVHEVPGDHVTLIEPPHSKSLAQRLRECLNAASAQTDNDGGSGNIGPT